MTFVRDMALLIRNCRRAGRVISHLAAVDQGPIELPSGAVLSATAQLVQRSISPLLLATTRDASMNPGLPRTILYLAFVLIVAGIVLHGIAFAEFQRIWAHLIDRPSGSLALRFILQPSMSAIFAVRDGIRDARTGRSPYFWTIVSDPQKRRDRLREGLDATGKIILIAIALDAIYQYVTSKNFFPVEALLVAIFLAFIPYFLLRGPVDRIAQWWLARRAGPAT